MKTKSGMDMRSLLETIKNETRPIDGHTDAEAIEDCWREVFETLFPTPPKFHEGDPVVHIDFPEYGIGFIQEISKSGKRAKAKFPNYDRNRFISEPRGYYTFEKLRHAPEGEFY